jgi:hypothetical protein
MADSSKSRKAGEWQRRMRRFWKAGESVAEFCRKEGVSAPSFYQWRKRLTRQPRPREEVSGFKAVRLVAAASVAVRLPGGTQLEVPTADPEVLRLVIDRLARADARRAGGDSC